jgi:uncharacterized protein YlxP (DUF503 family)
MTIGVLKLVLYIPGSNSLKDKRAALNSLKARLRNNFNVALTQIDEEQKWQKTMLVAVGVEKDRAGMNSALSGLLNFMEKSDSVDIIDYEMEII